MKYRSCKDCPHYDKCVTTSNLAIKRKRCEFADNSRSKKTMTNFDRIKAMSVDEFVEWVLYDKNKITCRYASSFIGLKEWLESEVQGE